MLLGSEARLITASRGGFAVLPSARLTSDARIEWIDGPAAISRLNSSNAGRNAPLGDARAACLLIARARLDIIRDILTTDGDKSLPDRIHLANPHFKPAQGLDHSTVTIVVLKKK